MMGYALNVIALFIAAGILNRIPYCRNKRGEANIGELSVAIGNTVYKIRGHFKPKGLTLKEKLLRNMEKELEKSTVLCYDFVKSQKGLDCKRERSSL